MAEQPEQQAPAPPRASVLVVSHNRSDMLRRCLESLERSEARETFEIVVVDNGSSDSSPAVVEEFQAVRFVRLPKNVGLTKALNIGIRAIRTEFVLLLHEDTEVEPGAIRLLTETIESRPDAGAVCPLLVDPEGRPAPQLGSFPPDGRYRPAEPGDEPVAIEYARGAAVMFRLFFLRALRQIDERYGQFGSDADLAVQVRRASKKTLLVPRARVVHHGRNDNSALRRADLRIGRAVWIGKYKGFGVGLAARLAAMLQPLLSLHLGEFRNTASWRKIDGNHL